MNIRSRWNDIEYQVERLTHVVLGAEYRRSVSSICHTFSKGWSNRPEMRRMLVRFSDGLGQVHDQMRWPVKEL